MPSSSPDRLSTAELERLHECYHNNAFPSMLDELGEQIGVSRETLERLEVGWAPGIKDKNGTLRYNYWTIPERTGTGRVMGIATRAQDGSFKGSVFGGGRGLTLALNPEHRVGKVAFKRGAHNWVRTSHTLPCPVCRKPDGCLISRAGLNENAPHAVVCRVEKTDRAVKFGWLHILEEEANEARISGASLVEPSELPILIVEGFTDTAHGLQLGFPTIGKSTNLSNSAELRKACKDRDVLILGENDEKPDGRFPGKQGALKTFYDLMGTARSCKWMMPPSQVKDLRDWVTNHKLTGEALLAYAADHATAVTDSILPDDHQPTIIKAWQRDTHAGVDGECLLVGDETRDQMCRYTGTHYGEMTRGQFLTSLMEWVSEKQPRCIDVNNPGTAPQAVKIRASLVNQLWDLAKLIYAQDRGSHASMWLHNASERPNPDYIMPVQQGLLNIEDPSEPQLLAHTPDYYSRYVLPFAYDAEATCPVWEAFLESSLGDDPGNVPLLQEWFGYSLTQDNSYQKFMVLLGKSRAGKSLVTKVLEKLLGSDNVATAKMSLLANDHAGVNFIDKQHIIFGDARSPNNAAMNQTAQVLREIVGGDRISIRPLFKAEIAALIKARITIATNQYPHFPDADRSLDYRTLYLHFRRTFAGREDRTLEGRLLNELPGILNWSLKGLARLRENHQFTEPEESTKLRQIRVNEANPAQMFLNKFTEPSDSSLDLEYVYGLYRQHAALCGKRPQSITRFVEDLRGFSNYAIVGDHILGIALTGDAAQKL